MPGSTSSLRTVRARRNKALADCCQVVWCGSALLRLITVLLELSKSITESFDKILFSNGIMKRIRQPIQLFGAVYKFLVVLGFALIFSPNTRDVFSSTGQDRDGLNCCFYSGALAQITDEPAKSRGSKDPQPLQLVHPDADHVRLLLNEENLKKLEKISGPIAVITAVGPIHSGKSFLLNQLLGSTHGFDVGYSVRPGTMGLQMWSEPILVKGQAEGVPDVSVLLLDTEGFGGPNVTRTYDNSIYAIAALSSTELLFTTMKMIDSQALEELEEMTRDANLFSLRAHSELTNEQPSKGGTALDDGKEEEAENENASFESSHPRMKDLGLAGIQSLTATGLTWVVQDFVQDLEGLTPLQWLDSLLDATRRSTNISAVAKWSAAKEEGKQKSSIFSHSLRDIYPSIDCVTFRAPAEVDQMQRLDMLSTGDLNFEYREQLDNWRRKLLRRVALSPKMREGSGGSVTTSPLTERFWSGADLADMLRFFVSAANNNFWGSLHSFVEEFRKVRAELARNDLVRLFRTDVQSVTNRVPPPFLPEIKSHYQRSYQKTLQQWDVQVVGEGDWTKEIKEKLDSQLLEIRSEFVLLAEEKIRAYCYRLCESQESELQGEILARRKTLPVMPEQLEEWMATGTRQHKANLQLQEGVETSSGSFAKACSDELKRFEVTVAEVYRRFRQENTNAIVRIVDEGIQLAVSSFVHALQDGRNSMEFQLPLSEFKNSLLVWKAAAVQAFEQHVGPLRNADPVKETCWADLQQSLKEVEDSGRLRWDQKCEEAAMEIVNHWAATLAVEVLVEFRHGLPVDEDSLRAQFAIKEAEAQQALAGLYCAKSTAWNRAARAMSSKLLAIRLDLEAQNVTAIKVNCKEPLDRLRDKLENEAAEFYAWSSFLDVARARALELLQSQQAQNRTSVQLSEKLVVKVTENWLSTDIQTAYFDVVNGNWWHLVYSVTGWSSIVGGGFVVCFSSNWLGLVILALGTVGSWGPSTVLWTTTQYFYLVISACLRKTSSWVGTELFFVLFALSSAAIAIMCFYGVQRYFVERGEKKPDSSLGSRFDEMNKGRPSQLKADFPASQQCQGSTDYQSHQFATPTQLTESGPVNSVYYPSVCPRASCSAEQPYTPGSGGTGCGYYTSPRKHTLNGY